MALNRIRLHFTHQQLLNIPLNWEIGSVPHLVLNLNGQGMENEISGTEISELDFVVDDKKVTRWIRQRDGSWAGKRSLAIEPERLGNQPNLDPKMLTIRSGSGDVLIEWDFESSGMAEEVLIFDLDRQRKIDFGKERLAPYGHYAVLCDNDCDLRGCTPVSRFRRDSISRQAWRLPSPLEESISIEFQDFLLWQPLKLDEEKKPSFPTVLRSPHSVLSRLNDRTLLMVEGIPDGAVDPKLLIHRTIHALIREDSYWRTPTAITLTPEIAAKQRRIRIQFALDGRQHTVEPKLSLNILGIAMIRYKETNHGNTILLDPISGDVINRSEGTAFLRVWTPNQSGTATVFEGEHRIGPLRDSRVKLRDIPGYGEELRVVDNGNSYPMGVKCQDNGYIRGFSPAMLGSSAMLFLKEAKDLKNDGYFLCEWALDHHKAIFRTLPRHVVGKGVNERAWQIECSSSLLALALTFKGERIAAWWDIDQISRYIKSSIDLPLKDYVAMKWFRVPVLSPPIQDALKRTISRKPIHFCNAWLGEGELPRELVYREGEFDEMVLRHFFWNEFPVPYRGEAVRVFGQCTPRFDENKCCKHLEQLGHMSLPLLWTGMNTCRRRCEEHYPLLAKKFFLSQIGLHQDDRSALEQVRLRMLQDRAANAALIQRERLQEVCNFRVKNLEGPAYALTTQDLHDLLALGASQSGRSYVAAHFAQHLGFKTH